MSKWSTIYREQLAASGSLDSFILNKIGYKKKLISIVERYANNNKTILEVGCGSGITSVYLSSLGYKAVGVDSDPDQIKLARWIAKKKKCRALFKIDDIRTLKHTKNHFDVIFSNGVMEHFSDAEIVAMVNLHLSTAKYVIISVPSDYFTKKQRIFGNERFMNAERWRTILSKTNSGRVKEFSFGAKKQSKKRDRSGNLLTREKTSFIGFILHQNQPQLKNLKGRAVLKRAG